MALTMGHPCSLRMKTPLLAVHVREGRPAALPGYPLASLRNSDLGELGLQPRRGKFGLRPHQGTMLQPHL